MQTISGLEKIYTKHDDSAPQWPADIKRAMHMVMTNDERVKPYEPKKIFGLPDLGPVQGGAKEPRMLNRHVNEHTMREMEHKKLMDQLQIEQERHSQDMSRIYKKQRKGSKSRRRR